MQIKTDVPAEVRDILRGAHILLVDDCSDFTLLMQHFLCRLEVNLDVALDAMNGLQMARVVSYDLMLVDIVLPQLDGCEFIRRVRRTGYAHPILVLSAHICRTATTSVKAAGATGFMPKPVILATLAEAMAHCLRAC